MNERERRIIAAADHEDFPVGPLEDGPLWKCPHCGGTDTWFDRTFEVGADGVERGPFTRCTGCGRDVDEPLPAGPGKPEEVLLLQAERLDF